MDVAHALIYLEDNFHIENRYILAGHSAGATMAFELHSWYMNGEPLPKPSCVLGIAGIYNFEGFLEAHKNISAYKELMENAFPDKGLWKEASPYRSHLPGMANWEHAKAVIISHSDQDELVERAQADFMLERLRKTQHFEGKIHFLEASGAHDEIWQSGQVLADLISKSLQLV
jgi:kynurenine formamidase